MISARQASLQAQRTRYRGLASSRRVFNPNSLAAAGLSAARRSADAEMSNMVSRYADGLEGNDAMLAYLTKAKNNPLFTLQEKVQIQDKIRDFQGRVRGEKLEAMYRAAPEQSFQRVQAAQALSSFYQTEAAGMQADTPAQSRMLQQSAQWGNAASAEQDKILKTGRQQLRAAKFYELAQGEQGTEQALRDKAAALSALADNADLDAAATEATQYRIQAQNTLNDIPILKQRLAEKEAKKLQNATKSEIVTEMDNLENQYHDGKIAEGEYLAKLAGLAPKVDEFNDGGLNRRFDRTADTVQKNLEKGGLRRTTTASGLPVVLGKNKGGTAVTDWDVQDSEFEDDTKQISQMMVSGTRPDGTAFTMQDYANGSAIVLRNREEQLNKRLEVLNGMDENAKVYYDGKKQRVEDLTRKFDEELTVSSGKLLGDDTEDGGISSKIDMLVNDRVVPVMIGPTEFSKSGDIRSKKTSVARLDFVSASQLPPNMYAPDERGIYHPIRQERKYLTDEEALEAAQNFGFFTTGEGNAARDVRVKQDASGNSYIETGKQYVDIYEPNSGFKVTRPYGGEKQIPGLTQDEIRGFRKNAQPSAEQPIDLSNMQGQQEQMATESARRQQEQERVKNVDLSGYGNIPLRPEEPAPVVVKPQAQPVPETDYVSPPEAKPSTVRIEPAREVNLSSYGRIPLGQSLLPSGAGRTVTDTRPMKIIEPAKENRLYSAAPAPTPLQQSGIKIDLGPQFAPYIPPKQPSLLQQAAGGISSLFQFLKPKQNQDVKIKSPVKFL